jgi:hypothetical protein
MLLIKFLEFFCKNKNLQKAEIVLVHCRMLPHFCIINFCEHIKTHQTSQTNSTTFIQHE